MSDRVPCQTWLGYSAEVHQFLTKWSRNWARNQRIPYLSKSDVFLSLDDFSDLSGGHSEPKGVTKAVDNSPILLYRASTKLMVSRWHLVRKKCHFVPSSWVRAPPPSWGCSVNARASGTTLWVCRINLDHNLGRKPNNWIKNNSLSWMQFMTRRHLG